MSATIEVQKTIIEDLEVQAIHNLRRLVRDDMRARNMSLNAYAEQVLRSDPSTLSRFLSNERQGKGFELFFQIMFVLNLDLPDIGISVDTDSTVEYSNSADQDLKAFFNGLRRALIDKKNKYGAYDNLVKVSGVSKTPMLSIINEGRLPYTSSVLRLMIFMKKGLRQLIKEGRKRVF